MQHARWRDNLTLPYDVRWIRYSVTGFGPILCIEDISYGAQKRVARVRALCPWCPELILLVLQQ